MNAIIQYNDDKEKSNEQTANERGFTITCDNCDEEFDPWDVTRSIINQDTALYTCLSCSNGSV